MRTQNNSYQSRAPLSKSELELVELVKVWISEYKTASNAVKEYLQDEEDQIWVNFRH